MVEISGANIITKALEDNEARYVFSHPGGPILPIYDTLRERPSVRNILVRHEGAGSFMADAFSRVSGKIGVCMSTMGPGAENMTIGVATAYSDSVPLLAITGQLSTTVLGRGYQQETDHVSMFRPITKWSTQVLRTESLPATLRRAFCVAFENRPGPVHLDIPRDVQLEKVDVDLGSGRAALISNIAQPRESIERTISMLSESRHPVLLVGGGVITANAGEHLTRLARTLRLPVVTSYNGRGAVSEEIEEALGRAGEFTVPIPGRVLEKADLILVLGYRFTDVSTEGWHPAKQARIIQVDIDSKELGKNVRVDLAIHSDARLFLDSLLSLIDAEKSSNLRRDDWLVECARALADWKKSYQETMLSKAKPIKPQRVIYEINRRLPKDAIVVAGAGRCKTWAATLIPIRAPRCWIHSGGYAPMGYPLCGAIGAKFAEPRKCVLAIDGDASFQMHCQEIATAKEHDLPVVVCVLNDMGLGAMRTAQIHSYGRRMFGVDFNVDVNTAIVAEAFGGAGERVDDPEAIGPALDRALSSKVPFVIDVVVDREEEPIFR
ncbi:MAG: thiamine pyrophosphate-binding protein [Candidatus Bathyarchaeia archaeon]|jgi:acetolactate synthase-1/2/3 large subunit